jgi:hypothetical protein
MIQIRQITTVTDYVDRFSELFDQLSAYEVTPDIMHYTTRFIEGLLPAIHMAVAIQQPADLDKAVELALLFEELVEEPEFLSAPSSPSFQSTASRHSSPFQLQPKQSVTKTLEDRQPKNHPRSSSVDDRSSQLRAYRKAKGLCFLCGEKWSRDHQCKGYVQLHVVQEMLQFMQLDDQPYLEREDAVGVAPSQLMCVSAAAQGKESAPQTLLIDATIQGIPVKLLIDSGSTHSFLDDKFLLQLTGVSSMRPMSVTIANGTDIQCTTQLAHCSWDSNGHTFQSNFRFLPLGAYDGIVGLDWLIPHSPMLVDWEQKWMNVPHNGGRATLLGDCYANVPYTLCELSAILSEEPEPVPAQVQAVLDQFASVFATPTGLPPRRRFDHVIPLIPGARPVSVRPYRVVPELNTEIENQVAELIEQGEEG